MHRKIARLRESVIAVRQTLLAKRHGKTPVGGDGRQLKVAERLLDEADTAIQRAAARQRDWSADEAALVEIILQDAAKAVVESARKASGKDHKPVAQAIQESLVEVGQMARDVVTGLQKTLSRTLEALEKTSPLAKAEMAVIRNAPLPGLPVIDISPLSAKCDLSIPGWATLVPRIAHWKARSMLDTQLADQLRQSVRLYNAQVRAWLKTSIRSLVEPYQSQAEVFREQLRRMTTGAESDSAADTADLVRNLRELERAGSAEGVTATGEEASHQPSTDGAEASKRHNRGTAAATSNPQ